MPEKSLKGCHDEGRHILTIDKMRLYASSNRHSYARYDLIINLTGYASYSYDSPTGEYGAATLAPTFLSKWNQPDAAQVPQLVLPWRDGYAPTYSKKDWLALLDDLRAIKGRVLIHCMGGHGRTGTALAILLALSGALKKDPVTWLRKNYCVKSVESAEQIKYIQSMGIRTKEKPSHMPISTPSSSRYYDIPYTWAQEQYDLTKSSLPSVTHCDRPDAVILYKCIQCQRKRVGSHFHQTFLDMTGLCWDCYDLLKKTNPDIQSA